MLAALLAAAWVRYGHRVDLALFFQVTSIFLVLFALQLLFYAFHEFTEANALPIDNAYWHLATEEWAEGTYARSSARAGARAAAWLGYASFRTREHGGFRKRPSFTTASQPAVSRTAPARDQGLTAIHTTMGDGFMTSFKRRPLAAAILALLSTPPLAFAQAQPDQTLPEVKVQAEAERADGPVDGLPRHALLHRHQDRYAAQGGACVGHRRPGQLMKDQAMQSMGDVFRYVPGVLMHQGEGNRDQIVIRGTSTTADFYVDGVRDDAQVFRDLYNLERVEVLKGPGGHDLRPRRRRRRGQSRHQEAGCSSSVARSDRHRRQLEPAARHGRPGQQDGRFGAHGA